MQLYINKYIGDGNATQEISVPADWLGGPQIISLQCHSNAVLDRNFHYTADMPAGKSIMPWDNVGLIDDGISAVGTSSFTVTDPNENNEEYGYFIARSLTGDSDHEFAHGSYTGDGIDNTDISIGQTWTPVVVVVLRAGASYPHFSCFQFGNYSYPLRAGSRVLDRIQSAAAGTFTIGTHDDVNARDDTYYWYAFNTVDNHIEAGQYKGDGLAGHDIVLSDPFSPHYCLTKTEAAGWATFHRWYLETLGRAGNFGGSPLDDIISAMNADGFELGSHNAINQDGLFFSYFAARSGNGWDDTVSATAVATATITATFTDTVTSAAITDSVSKGTATSDALSKGTSISDSATKGTAITDAK